MRLLLRRDQKAGIMGMGKVAFTLDVRADLTAEELANIRKYKLGETMLYQSHEIVGGKGLLGVATRLAWKAITLHLSVNDLTNGKKIEVKDVVEMLAIEDQIREAATTFAAVLAAAATFGGEEIVEL